MKCSKCDGLMILQSFIDHYMNVDGWKCINCGRVVPKKDKTIEPDVFGMYFQHHKNKNK